MTTKTYSRALPAPDPYEKRKLVDRRSKETMKYCPDCQRVWEIARGGNNSTGKLVHYYGMPTIGKPHEICSQCKVKLDKSLNF